MAPSGWGGGLTTPSVCDAIPAGGAAGQGAAVPVLRGTHGTVGGSASGWAQPGGSEAGFSPGVAPGIKNQEPGPLAGAPLGPSPGVRPCQAMPTASATTTTVLVSQGHQGPRGAAGPGWGLQAPGWVLGRTWDTPTRGGESQPHAEPQALVASCLRTGAWASVSPSAGSCTLSFHREAGRQAGVRCPCHGTTDHVPLLQLLLGIQLLAWLPSSRAHQGHPLWGAPQPHRTPRCYSAEELHDGQPPPHLLARSARWEQALPVALVSSLEAEGRRPQHQGPLAGSQCPTLRPEQVLTADTHQRSISPWRYR